MARRKNYFNFTDFNYVDGAIDLFHNTIRKSFEYDSLTDDIFTARVLTNPTPVVQNAYALNNGASDKNQKFSFRVRIIGANSPHKFLEDPCNLDDAATNDIAADVFSIIQNHTQVILYDNGVQEKPKIGDTVSIKLSKTGNTYDLKIAKQYIGITSVSDSTVAVTTRRSECENLSSLFENFNFESLSSTQTSDIIVAFENELDTIITNLGLPFYVTDRSRTPEQQVERIKNKYRTNGYDEVKKTYGTNVANAAKKAIELNQESDLISIAPTTSRHLKGAAIDIRSKHYNVNDSSGDQIGLVLDEIKKLGATYILEPTSTGCWDANGARVGDTPAIGKCANEHIHINIPSSFKPSFVSQYTEEAAEAASPYDEAYEESPTG